MGVGTRTSLGGQMVSYPDKGSGFNNDDLEKLSVSMRRQGPFFMGHDVRSEESSRLIARDLLLALWFMGYTKPEPVEPLEPPLSEEVGEPR